MFRKDERTSMRGVLVMIEGVYLQKLLIIADAVRLLVLSWSFVYYWVRNLLTLYYVIVMIFVDGIEKKNVTNKKRRSIKKKRTICASIMLDKKISCFKCQTQT